MTTFGKIRLGETLTFQRGFDITKAEQTPGDVPIVSSSGISSYHNVAKQSAPGVIIGRKGTLGTVHLVASRYWPHDTTLWVKDFKGNDPKFLYYFLQTLKLENFDTGSSNPTLNRNHLHKIEVWFPKDLAIQRKIAGVLSAYDDLIENNRRRIAILENMAEEIYREWFVRMRFPGHQNAKFEKGVPVGWEDCKLSEVFDFLEGPGIMRHQYRDSGTKFMNIRLIQNGDIDPSNANHVSEEESGGRYSHFMLQAGDYVLSTSGTIGRGAIVREHHLPLMLNTSVIRFRPRKELHREFMYRFLQSSLFLKQVETYAIGAAQQNFGPTHLKIMRLLLPSDCVVEKFSRVASPIANQMSVLRDSTRRLAAMRDALLTRLISGKLSVDELDIQLPPSMRGDPAEEASEEPVHA